jgi:hypothetical protein
MSNERVEAITSRPARNSRPTVAAAVAVALAGLLVAACGGGDDGDTADSKKTAAETADTAAAGSKAGGAGATNVKVTPPADARMASAVADSKTSAPIDLLYDLPVKPEVGQPFTVELAVKPRVPADTLDLDIGDSPGITIDGERMARFPNVEAGTSYTFNVQARGDAPGLYYVTVVAKLSTSVQTEGRAFSVPVVVGSPVAAAQKPAPATDATGQAVESLPAKED